MTNPPPDITVTRADVLALPLRSYLDVPEAPAEGRTWHLERNDNPHAEGITGRLMWVDLPAGIPFDKRAMWSDVHKCDTARHLTPEQVETAERAFLWQTALASDAAFGDINADPLLPFGPGSRPGQTMPDRSLTAADVAAIVRAVLREQTRDAVVRVMSGEGIVRRNAGTVD